jgi:phosphoribosyl 1,2-cyclic phosphodiesterase
MNVKFYGVRGSIPACGKEFQLYGGNTTCIRIYRETVNRLVIFDAGTGLRNLGKDIVAQNIHQNIINIIFSHFHWDHIQGLPFFAPAYDKEQKIGMLVMGKDRKYKDLKEIFTIPMQMEYFPVELQAMGAQFEFISLGDKETFYGALVTAVPQHHAASSGSYGFRIQDESGALVICTDLEHVDGLDEKIVGLAQNADLLIHDGQYTPAEYENKKGWGHSSWEHAVAVAKKANVKKLVITHHDPDHDDAFLEAMEKECKNAFPNSCFAKEGMEIDV